MHIRHTRIYHRRYPEVRGKAGSLAEAASHLVNQLTCGLDFVRGREREAVERAVAEVRAFRSSRPRHRPGSLAAVHDAVIASEPSTFHPLYMERFHVNRFDEMAWRGERTSCRPTSSP